MTATLRAAVGDYPHTRALKEGRIPSDLLRLDFAPVAPINRAFASMVRDAAFDVSEMAIATFLQARAHGKDLVLLPVVLAQRFQEGALICRQDSPLGGPADLRGRRVGVRAYSQTTGMWLRGILADEYGVAADSIRWITFEGAHVAEVEDPPCAERAPPGADMMAMLADGSVDAVIVGNDLPNDPGLRTVFPDPGAAGRVFAAHHGVTPPNHLLTVARTVADRDPHAVAELMRLFAASFAASADGGDGAAPPIGFANVQPGVALALRFAAAQGLLPRPLTEAEVWAGLPDAARTSEMTA